MKLDHDPFNLVITGVGGQGNVLVSHVLGLACAAQGLQVTVSETYGLSQRGGSVMSHLRLSRARDLGGLIGERQAHAVMALEPLEGLRAAAVFAAPGAALLINDRPVHPLNVIAGQDRYPSAQELQDGLKRLGQRLLWVGATGLAQALGKAVMANVVLLGAGLAAGFFPPGIEPVSLALGELMEGQRLEENRRALLAGAAWAEGARA